MAVVFGFRPGEGSAIGLPAAEGDDSAHDYYASQTSDDVHQILHVEAAALIDFPLLKPKAIKVTPPGPGRSWPGFAIAGSCQESFELPNATVVASFTAYGTVGTEQARIAWVYSKSSLFEAIALAGPASLTADTADKFNAAIQGSSLGSHWGGLDFSTSVEDGVVGQYHSTAAVGTIAVTTHVSDHHGDNVDIEGRFTVLPRRPSGLLEKTAGVAVAVGATIVTVGPKVVQGCFDNPVVCAEVVGGGANG